MHLDTRMIFIHMHGKNAIFAYKQIYVKNIYIKKVPNRRRIKSGTTYIYNALLSNRNS